MKGLRLLLFLFLASVLTHAKGQHTVSGRVVDSENGEGLIGTHIYSMSDWRNGSIAGVNGEFRIELKSETDSLIISFVGFEEKVVAAEDGMVVALFAIAVAGAEVVVTAEPLIAEEFKYLKLDKLDVYTNPSAKADPILAVGSLPSSTTTDESANISLRGSSPIETSIMLNNVPIYDAVRYSQLNGIGTFSIFNTSIIKDVTVYPGNPPLEFGNTTAGVIALTTDDRVLEDNANSAIISLASIGFSREQRLSDNQSLKLFSNWQPSGAIKSVNETSLEQIRSFEAIDFGAYWYGAIDRLKWKLFSYSINEGYQFNFKHPSFDGVFDQRKKRTFLTSSLESNIWEGTLSFNSGVNLSAGDYGYSNVAFEVNQNDFFSSLNYLKVNTEWSLKTGLSIDSRGASVLGNFHEFGYALGANHPTIDVDEHIRTNTIESYLYAKKFVTDKLTIGAGFRSNFLWENDSYLSRQINAVYATDHWTFTFGAGKYFKSGLIENSGEPFESESSQVSADIKHAVGSRTITLSLFSKDNRINQSPYNAQGVEFFIEEDLLSNLTGSMSITWLDAFSDEESFQFDIDYFVRADLSYRPGRMWTLEAILLGRQGSEFIPVQSARFDNELNVFEPFRSDLAERLPSYLNISLSINKILPISEKMNMICFASVGNFVDRKNIRSYTYDIDYQSRTADYFSRRTTYFGAIVNF